MKKGYPHREPNTGTNLMMRAAASPTDHRQRVIANESQRIVNGFASRPGLGYGSEMHQNPADRGLTGAKWISWIIGTQKPP